MEICQSWQLALISIQWKNISAHLPARFGSDAGAYVRCGSGPATTPNRQHCPARLLVTQRCPTLGLFDRRDDRQLALLQWAALPPTRTQTFAEEFVKPAIDVDTLTRRNSAWQRSPCHPPASPSTLPWPRTTITESQIRAGCTRPDHHHRTLSPIPHPSPPRLPYRQLLTLGATTAVAQTDMFEPETDLPRSLSAVTQLQSWASQQHRPPPSCRRPAPRLGHASGPCRAAAGWRHNPHSITLRFQFPSPNIHDAELERRRAGECRC